MNFAMNKLFKYIKSRFFCKHEWNSVENSKWYFHWKCQKCHAEKGIGGFH